MELSIPTHTHTSSIWKAAVISTRYSKTSSPFRCPWSARNLNFIYRSAAIWLCVMWSVIKTCTGVSTAWKCTTFLWSRHYRTENSISAPVVTMETRIWLTHSHQGNCIRCILYIVVKLITYLLPRHLLCYFRTLVAQHRLRSTTIVLVNSVAPCAIFPFSRWKPNALLLSLQTKCERRMTVLLYTPFNEKSGVCYLHVRTVTPEVRTSVRASVPSGCVM